MTAHRLGFSLVEAIVVILVIGLLLAMLFPAIDVAREAARNTLCKNNLRQIVLAVQSHESAQRALPDLYNGSFLPRPRTVVDEYHFFSWRTAILPHLEENNTLGVLDTAIPATDEKNQQAINSELPIFLCPSTSNTNSNVPGIVPFSNIPFDNGTLPETAQLTAARSDYEAIGGVQVASIVTSSADLSDIRFGAWGEPTYKRNAGFSVRYRKARFSDVSDGLSNTFLVGERGGRPDLFRRGQPIDPYPYRDPSQAMDHHQAAWALSTHFRWLVFWHEQSVNETNATGIFGFHQGGANVGLADGAVRFLDDATDSAVLKSYATRAGAEAVSFK